MPDNSEYKTILGIDLGSRNVKTARWENGIVISTSTFETITFYKQFGRQSEGGFLIDLSAPEFAGVKKVVATGYGRMAASVTGAENISEISAHYFGAIYQTNLRDFTLVDIGGQDFKLMWIENGDIKDFATNDKCAASSGRYLENMARVLGITLEEIGRYYEDPVSLSSTCAIFGESELIGKIVRGEPVSRCAAGVNRSIVERFMPFLNRMGEGLIVLSGGVALNGAVVRLMKDMTGREVTVLDDPVHNGAIGCCVSKKTV
ncbi:MAG: 2-hydroxyglutaryl-CoA dehydratase [Candidatus Latescibacteria bacterium]|nr:2-hydroxyglutaryl-CoA dehydratase [Candidatus Latescibacterota bacterium]